MKRILFCNPLPITKELGGSKVTVELAEAMRDIGWQCDVIGSNDILSSGAPFDRLSRIAYSEGLHIHLKRYAHRYDVVDYDHSYLPYPRTDFAPNTLLVARSVLLAHYLETIPIPEPQTLRGVVGRFMNRKRRRKETQWNVERATVTIHEADLVNVSNHEDKDELMRRGVPPEKVIVIPYGISRARRSLFDKVSSVPPPHPIIAFVGTFDYRKGAQEFPQIVRAVANEVPEVRFRLLGVKGLFKTEAEILSFFSRHLREKIEVILQFKPDELPGLLAGCSLGVFPSHMEGFGFGVLEMLSASVPVIAYNAPGPPMMLPPKYLVSRGDTQALSNRVLAFLKDSEQLTVARAWAKSRSQEFSWDRCACDTDVAYRSAIVSHGELINKPTGAVV